MQSLPATGLIAMQPPVLALTLQRRRRLASALALSPLAALSSTAWLAGCAAPGPAPSPVGSSSAQARLQECAQAHGLAAWRGLRDINLAWTPAGPAAGARPTLFSAAASQARWLPASGLWAQHQPDPTGDKHLLRRWATSGQAASTGTIALWHAGRPLTQPEPLAAAVQAADIQRLLLAGPLLLADISTPVNWGPPETLDDRRCDLLTLAWPPALGGAPGATLTLTVDREQNLLRRLRLSLGGAASARDKVVRLLDPAPRHGVVWPRRLGVEDDEPWPSPRRSTWQLTGLDVNRGYPDAALEGPEFAGTAAAPALAWPLG